MSEFESINNERAREWEAAGYTRTLRAALSHTPLSAVFELTPLCSLNCKMCYIRMSTDEMDRLGRELTTEEWLRLARETFELETLNLLLTGGEPLMRPDFEELYTELAHMGFLVNLNTNATLLTPRIIDLFAKYPPSGGFAVTLYGASPETYEAVCGNADAFNKVIEGLEAISTFPTTLAVRSTFVKANRHEYQKMHEIADRYTGTYAINPFVTKPVRGAIRDIENIRMTAEEAFWVDGEYVEDYRKRQQGDVSKEEKLTKMELIGEDRIKQVTEMVRTFRNTPPALFQCGAVKTQYTVSWDGKMIPCLNFATPYTLPLEIGVKAAWDQLLEESVKIPPCSECKDCEYSGYCMNCPGYLQAETGSFEKAAPYLCSLAKIKKQLYQNKTLDSFERRKEP